MGTFVLKKNRKGEWKWGLFVKNGKEICWSGETYKNRVDAVKIMERLTTYAAIAWDKFADSEEE